MYQHFKTKEVPERIDGKTFDKELFKSCGVFVVRDFIPGDEIKEIISIWNNYKGEIESKGGRRKDSRNLVNFLEELPDRLKFYWKSDSVKKIATQVYGPNVALFAHRILIKDRGLQHSVMLHQDYCYQLGFPNKCSLFIPLTKSGFKEGSLRFYPGTHQYGYLGDAGEIDKSKFDEWNSILPELNPGDVAIMNSCLWHESGPNNSDTDRVMFQITIQPTNDPTGRELISGKWETDFWIDRNRKEHSIDKLFLNSRINRLKNLYSELEKLKGQA